MQLMGRKLSDHKGTLKPRYIKNCNMHEGMIKNFPKNIRMREWVPFVNHILTTKAKDEFETLFMSELESSELIDEDEIYHKMVGKERHGHVCEYGLGHTPTSVFGANPCRLDLLGKLTETNKFNEKMQTKVEELEKKDENRRKMEEDNKRMEEERKRMEEVCKLELQIRRFLVVQLRCTVEDSSESNTFDFMLLFYLFVHYILGTSY